MTPEQRTRLRHLREWRALRRNLKLCGVTLKWLAIGSLLLILPACNSLAFWNPATSETEWVRRTDVCESWKKLGVSHQDVLTDGTQVQVRANNAARAVYCPTVDQQK